jgi:putative polyketide hydroxylase
VNNGKKDMQIYDEQSTVLIVGGGLVGLSQALFLQYQGIPFVLVERHAETSILPRARGLHFRSMEFYREIGLEQEILAAGAESIKQQSGKPGGLRIGETLVTAQAQQIGFNLHNLMGMKELTPTSFCFCPQDILEPILLAALRQRGGDVRFSTELTGFEQDENGVVATIVEVGNVTTRHLRTDYLIAADGAHSPIRDALGITTSGKGTLEHYLNIYFLADLSELVQGRTFSQCQVENTHVRGTFAALNNTDRWIFHLSYNPEAGEKPEDFPPERCLELLRQAIGVSDIAIEIKSIGPWEAAVRVADRYQQGRILLVGDAAHLMPPWGGFGGNTGIADAHNLAWKLAAVIRGQATPALLSTYEMERRPVACVAGEQAALGTDVYTRYRIATATNAKDLEQQIDPLLVTLGYHYHSTAVIENGLVASAPTDPFTLTGEPGTRAPHSWFKRQGETVSTLDLVGTNFVLLAGEKGEAWCEAARMIAAGSGINLVAYRVGPTGDLQDLENEDTENHDHDALLVRPDGFVAWQSSQDTPATQETLSEVLKHILAWYPQIPLQGTSEKPA